MMDRRKRHQLPKMQVGFIDSVCLPLYEVIKYFILLIDYQIGII